MVRRALHGLAAGAAMLALTASVASAPGTSASAAPGVSTGAVPTSDVPTSVALSSGASVGVALSSGVSAGAARPSRASTSAAPAGPTAPVAPIAGVPQPCAATHAWPGGARQADIVAQLSRNTGFQLTGADWSKPAYLPMVKIVWQTLDALSCTDYVRHVTRLHPGFSLNAAPISGYAWGDWGLTKPGATTLDFAKWTQALKAKDPGRLVRILVHELGHAWDSDRTGASYWNAYMALDKKVGAISNYGRRSPDENFSEVVGYYVARCAASNPYDNKKFAPYYTFAQQTVFGGRQFGGAPGTKATCNAPVG